MAIIAGGTGTVRKKQRRRFSVRKVSVPRSASTWWMVRARASDTRQPV